MTRLQDKEVEFIVLIENFDTIRAIEKAMLPFAFVFVFSQLKQEQNTEHIKAI